MTGANGLGAEIIGRPRLGAAAICAVISAIAMVIVPFLMAWITNIIVAGVIGRQIEGDASVAAAAERLRASGHPELASLVNSPGVVPGQGIDWTDLRNAAILLALTFVVVAATKGGGDLLVNATVQESVRRLRSRVQETLHRLPVDTVDGTRRGEILNSVSVDVANVGTLIAPLFVRLPVSLMSTIGIFIGLFLLSPMFAGIVLLTVPVSVVVVVLIARYSRPALERQWAETSELTAHVEDVYGAHRTLVALNAQQAADATMAGINERLRVAARRAQTLGGSITPALTAINALLFVFLAVVGAQRLLAGALTLGALQAIIMLALQLASPLSELAGILPRIQSGLVSLQRVRRFLSTPTEEHPAVDDERRPHPRHCKPPEIIFDDVHFAYSDGPAVLDGVTLHIPSGATVAIAGATGSGKTTMMALLQRFVDADAGRVLLDGVDIGEMSRRDVRSGMAVVAQEPWLFAGTAAENIAYGGAANHPEITEIVNRLPNGSATAIAGGAEEDSLSAGERQLLTVARALAAHPSVLILDEATSAADPRTEMLIQESLAGLRASTTTLVISHRLSTLAAADEIAVLADGRIVENGTFDELCAAGGHFARLHDLRRDGGEPVTKEVAYE